MLFRDHSEDVIACASASYLRRHVSADRTGEGVSFAPTFIALINVILLSSVFIPWTDQSLQNRNAIRKVVTIFTPGVLPEHVGLSTTSSPGMSPYHPITIPLPPSASISPSSSAPPLFGSPPALKVDSQKRVVKTLFGGTKEIQVASSAPSTSGPKLPFIARTFSHACPTRAPGDAGGARMHSVLGAFFQIGVTAEEKKRRTMEGLKGECSGDLHESIF